MNKITVVSVDDHYLIHAAIHGLLADHENIEVVGEGFAGASVLPLVQQYKPNVLILDLLMPQQQGGDLEKDSFQPLPTLAQLREEYPDTAIIILSQYLNEAIVQSAIQHGIRGYLLKSDNLSLNLTDAIQQVSRGGVYFSLEVSRQLFQRPETPAGDLLTYRQRQIILAIAKSPDTPYSEIADRFVITYRTLKGHLDGAYKALGVSNITACIIRCMQMGLIPFTQSGRGILFGDL
jgi:DNA-binding NarL/FixJ family response regulator